MTYNKAISIINDFDVNFEGHTAEEVADAMELAMKALEKQEPKPVQYTTDHTWGVKRKQPVCPVCDMYLTKMVFIPVEGHEDAPRISYCDSCGQAIDWSADDDT